MCIKLSKVKLVFITNLTLLIIHYKVIDELTSITSIKQENILLSRYPQAKEEY